MTCASCEERRQKLKALADGAAKSLTNAIDRLTGRSSKTEQSSDSAEQSVDSTDSNTKQSDSGVATTARPRARRTKRTQISG
jgi:hypothetical protein